MKFGKQIQSQQFTEWSSHYLDYKGLKKFIGVLLSEPQEGKTTTENQRPKLLQSQRAAFFFKLERELEKINSFYLQKENELKVRLRTLVDKKKVLQTDTRRLKQASTLLNAIQEAFLQFEQELNKIQKYVQLNNQGFRKILKKWDKRSKSTTKELYLSRQIDIQPCFNTQFLSELADVASTHRIELANIQSGIPDTALSEPTACTQEAATDVIDDLELELVKAVSTGQAPLVREILDRIALHPSPDDSERLSRVFWHACSEAHRDIIDMLIDTQLINFGYVDDINQRSCLHVASMVGRLDLLQVCTQLGANVRCPDDYGRTALHYATMNGFNDCVSFLLSQKADIESRDHDGFTPLIYAIMNGHTHCVAMLIHAGAEIEPKHDGDHIPLSLACFYGHTDIAVMLDHHGAKSLPNTESLYPLHLVARQGHQELCRILAQQSQYLDVPDKYYSWTPVFWAASDGHAECVRILIDAGCKVNIKDEYGKTALYYAAWEGNMECMELLIQAGCEVEALPASQTPAASDTPTLSDMELELDTIPSLSLPPPIIPFRIYGHSYLDRTYQIQISLRQPPIRLYDHTHISSLKLIISAKPDTGTIPHSVILPLADDQEIFSFQVDKLDDFLLEFDMFTTFGSKVLARGVALPETFASTDFKIRQGQRTVSLLDSHLKVIGELSFSYSVVKPFRGVQLEIGGRIETYWKSTNTVMPSATTLGGSSHPTPEPVGTPTSTSVPSFITASSLAGDYVHVVVQLTKDHVPVVYANWLVPFAGLDLAISDVTYQQLRNLGLKIISSDLKASLQDTHATTGNSMYIQRLAEHNPFMSLKEVLTRLPASMGIHLELKYPTVSELDLHTFSNIADCNVFVDAILQCVYDHVRSLSTDHASVRLFFSSFNPAICSVINWKQPNYAVFFNTYCGLNKHEIRRGMKRKDGDTDASLTWDACAKQKQDVRCTSLKEAVKFAKRTNLLGVMCEAAPLVKVPSLVKNIKESGLILATFGQANSDARCRNIQERCGVDAMMVREMIHFNTAMTSTGF